MGWGGVDGVWRGEAGRGGACVWGALQRCLRAVVPEQHSDSDAGAEEKGAAAAAAAAAAAVPAAGEDIPRVSASADRRQSSLCSRRSVSAEYCWAPE